MNFERIELTNWGPYRDDHSLDLKTSLSAPIVLIFGENGTGKTSLAKAFLWCLYGQNSKLSGANFANWTKVKESDPFQVSVKLFFAINLQASDSDDPSSQASTQQAELTRSFRARPDGRTSLGVIADEENVSLIIDGESPVTQNFIPNWVNLRLPYDMARFFLFDGEEIDSIKTDLESGTNSNIQSSIDSVLGLPAIVHLAELLSNEQKVVDTQEGKNARSEAARMALGGTLAIIESLERDRAKAIEDLAEVEKQTEEVIKEIDQNEDVRRKFELRKSAKSSLEDLISSRRGIQNEIRIRFSSSWWVPLADKIKVTKQREQERSVKAAEDKIARDHIASLRASREKGRCSTCGQQLDDDLLINKQIEDLENQIAEASPADESGMPSLDQFVSPEVEKVGIKSLFKEERATLTPIANFKREIGEIEQDVTTDDEYEGLRGLPEKRLILDRRSQTLKRAIEETRTDISVQQTKLTGMRKKIRKDVDLPSDLEKRSIALTQFDEIVQHVLNEFRTLVLDEVQKVASDNWREMINNDDLPSLQITKDYQVNAFNASLDEWKPVSSFGQSLIAVYAFVGALIEVSDYDGAWMIDTIASRLDSDKMRSVWEWLSSRNRQLIALPHSGELKIAEAAGYLGSKISCAYQIIPNEALDADSRFQKIQ